MPGILAFVFILQGSFMLSKAALVCNSNNAASRLICPDRYSWVTYCCGYNDDDNVFTDCCYYAAVWALWYFWFSIVMFLLVVGGTVACCKLVFQRGSDKSSQGDEVEVAELRPMQHDSMAAVQSAQVLQTMPDVPPSYEQVEQQGINAQYKEMGSYGTPATGPPTLPYDQARRNSSSSSSSSEHH